MRSILIRRSLRSHQRRFKRAPALRFGLHDWGGRRDVRRRHRRSTTSVRLMQRCLAVAALQLPTALDFMVHRSQFSDGLFANFVGFSFNTQTCLSSAPHVAAAAAHLFPLWLTDMQGLENRNWNWNRGFSSKTEPKSTKNQKSIAVTTLPYSSFLLMYVCNCQCLCVCRLMDIIVSVNGVTTVGVTHAGAVVALKRAGYTVDLVSSS